MAAVPQCARAGSFTTIYQLSQSPDGLQQVEAALIGYKGALYGTTAYGGANRNSPQDESGTVFKFDLATATETTLHSFTGGKKDGATPWAPLTQVGDALYGTTTQGHGTGAGSNGNYIGYGTVFRVNATTGKTSNLHGFSGQDGSQSYAGIVYANGYFYGTTWYGGANNTGTIFQVDKEGKFTSLYDFPANANGCQPLGAIVVVGQILYGTTTGCGAQSNGVLYSFDLASRTQSVLYDFPPPAGSGEGNTQPTGLYAYNGLLYGTTLTGGNSGYGSAYSFDPAKGKFTQLHSFGDVSGDGLYPPSGLVPFKGLLYGVTETGGSAYSGTIYSLDPVSGAETVLYNFTGKADGNYPFGALLPYKDALFGSTLNVALDNQGSLFKFVP